MAVPTYVASSKLAGATSGGTVPKPTGVVENDVMVALASVFGGSSPPTGLGLSGGWEKLIEVVQSGVPTNQYTTALFVRRAGASEPASYTLSGAGTGNWRLAVVAAYRGCRTSGAPYDAFSLAASAAPSTSAVAPSVTTLTKNTRLVWAESNEFGASHTPPTGYTERIDAEASLADAEKATAGATGAVTGTISESKYNVAGLVALASEAAPKTLSLADSTTPSESLTKKAKKGISDSTTPSEAYSKKAKKALADSVTPSETYTKTATKPLADSATATESWNFELVAPEPEPEPTTPRIVINREHPPTKLAVRIEAEDGTKLGRWAEDEAKVENVLGNLTTAGEMPGGRTESTCSLARDPNQSYPDLALFSRYTVEGAGGERLWSGTIRQEPQDTDANTITVKAVGDKQFLEDDETVVGPGFIDRDLSHWGDPSLSRKKVLNAGTFSTAGKNQMCVVASTGSGDDAVPGLIFRLGQVEEGRTPIGELWYRSGGPPIGSISFNGVVSATGGFEGDAHMDNKIDAARDDDATGEENIFEAHETGVTAYGAAPIGKGMTRLIVFMAYTSSIPTADYPNTYSFEHPTVIGDHGLSVYGAWPHLGLLAMQMIPMIAELGGLTTKDELLEDDGFIIPQAWFSDPGTPMSKLVEVTKYGLLDWFVNEDRILQYRKPGTYGRKWRLSPGSGAPKNAGPDANRIYDRLTVTWQDVDGTTKRAQVGPLTDERNAAVAAKRPRGKLLALNGVCTEELAIRTGTRFLEEAQNLAQSGEATVSGHVQDQYGIWYPAAYVQPGDWAADPGTQNYRKITSCNHSHDSKSTSITLGAPPEGESALEARFAAKLIELGLG